MIAAAAPPSTAACRATTSAVAEPVTVAQDIRFAVPDLGDRSDSLFFPSGTIRSLDDPIFDGSFATLGMYDPASFLEQAPTMFYALEEDLGYKIPVVFVHGIGGSARNFATFAEQLDPHIARLRNHGRRAGYWHYRGACAIQIVMGIANSHRIRP